MRHLVWVLLAACASTSTTKGASLVPIPTSITPRSTIEAKRYAVLVGVNEFEDPRFHPLRFAVADATALGAQLEGFDSVLTLTTPQQTTRASILEAIARLAREAQDPADTVFIYFSTHGSLAREPGSPLRRHLVTSDTRLDLVAQTGLSIDALSEAMHGFRARRVALVLATCHSGRGKSEVPDALEVALRQQKGTTPLWDRSEAVVVLSAASFGETAEENDAFGHDVYTHFFLEALREGDVDHDCAVTITEAHDYARQRTWDQTEGRQRPTAESAVTGVDPIVLRGRRCQIARPVVFSYVPSAEGLQVDLGGRFKGAFPGTVAAEAGTQSLSITNATDGRVVYQGTVELQAGERYDVSALLPRPPTWAFEASPTMRVTPLQDASRTLPTTVGLHVSAVLRAWPARSFDLGIGVTVLAGRGSEKVLGESIGFTAITESIDVTLQRTWSPGRKLQLGLALALGPEWMQRVISGGGFQGTQSLLGVRGSARVRLAVPIDDRFLIALDVLPTALLARFEGRLGPWFALGVAVTLQIGL